MDLKVHYKFPAFNVQMINYAHKLTPLREVNFKNFLMKCKIPAHVVKY